MDENLRRVFDQVKPSPEQKEAMLSRLLESERKVVPMKKMKKFVVFAVAAALMVISVAAANPEGVQKFFGDIASVIQVGQYREERKNADGETVAVYQIPDATVENRDGRAILVIDKKDAADITDALSSEGRYTYDVETQEGQLHILVKGTAEEWTVSVMIGELGDEKYLYTRTSRSDGSGESSAPGWSVPFADDSEDDVPDALAPEE